MMQRGERLKTKGYDVSATMSVAHGGGDPTKSWLVLLNNNSSHYLLCWAVYPDDEEVYFEESWEYFGEEEDNDPQSYLVAYESAITRMVTLAMRY